MKKIVIIGAVVVLIAVALFFVFRGKGNEPKFRFAPLTRGDVEMSVTATGTVNPVTTVLVGTQVSGTIKNIYVDFNSPVKKGQLIAQIDPALFDAQVNQAKANLLSAKANVEKARASEVDAKRTMERNRELLEKNLIAQSDFDTAQTNYETAKASVSAVQAQVKQAQAALSSAETNLFYTKIVSPVDGIVVSRNVDVGQTVAASFQTPTLFSIAQDLTKMQIDTNVAEADIGNVRVGEDVEFTVDAYPDITFNGKVWQVRNAPITVQNVVTYDVVIKVNNPDFKLKPGMTANVSIIISIKKDVLRIPNAALRFRPSGKDKTQPQQKGVAVWILEQGKPRRVPITPGISDGSYTELVSGALSDGQQLIVESLSKEKEASHTGPRMF